VTAGQLTPPGRFGATLVTDANDKLVLIGGTAGSTQPFDDLWVFDGGSWFDNGTRLSPNPRMTPVAYDDADGTLAVFCGKNSDDTLLWRFDGKEWSSSSSSLDNRFFQALGYDPVGDRLVMVGGLTYAFTVLADTYVRTTTTDWMMFSSASLPPRMNTRLVFEPSSETMMLFGGSGLGAPFGDTWELGNAGWEPVVVSEHPSAQTLPAMTSDPVGRRVVMLDQAGATWTFANQVWARLAVTTAPPVPPAGAVLAFDRARARTVLYGGYADPSIPDIWELVDDAWQPVVTNGPRPPPRSSPGWVYDRRRHGFVLLGGESPTGIYGDLWKLQWSSRTLDEICDNGVDDDDDRRIDAADPDCD
jgi:hypothetical protein